MTATTLPAQPHPRARSLSDSTAPAKLINHLPLPDGSKRAVMPRAASTLGMYSAARATVHDDDHYDLGREQVDLETLRDLAHFFRHTRPPGFRQDGDAAPDGCFGVPTPFGGDHDTKRWSIRSLRKGHRDKVKDRPRSFNVRDSTTLRTTAAGHTYMAIAVPPHQTVVDARASLQSRLSAWHQQNALGRNSIGDVVSVTSPEVNAVVQRSPSRADKNPFRLSIRVSAAEPGIRSLLKMVDNWLEEHNKVDSSQRAPGSDAFKKRASVSTLPTSAVSSIVEEEDRDDGNGNENDQSAKNISTSTTPTIMVKPATGASPTSVSLASPHTSTSCSPRTPPLPATESTEPAATMVQATEPLTRSPDSVSGFQLFAFPRSSSSATRKHQLAKSVRSSKEPADLPIKHTLEVPQNGMPIDSPGFPNMLAAMTFPSPPDSAHSRNNSMSAALPENALQSPPAFSRKSTSSAGPQQFPLEQPLLKQSRSDGAFHTREPRTSHTYDDETGEMVITKSPTTRPGQQLNSKPSRLVRVPGAEDIQDQIDSTDPYKRESTTSTVESSRYSLATVDRFRHSVTSDTSVQSEVTATADEETKGPSNNNRASTASSITESGLKRSNTTCSGRSGSSTTTDSTTTTATLAERRMARRARVREKVQRDLNATKLNTIGVQKPSFAEDESVDSPVLGWFTQSKATTLALQPMTTSKKGPSRLVLQLSAPTTPVDDAPAEGKPRHVFRRTSMGDISKMIPETVKETDSSPTTPKAAGVLTFSEILSEEVEPEAEEGGGEVAPTLSLSPIITVASIEPKSALGTQLRPLSLLTGGVTSPLVSPRPALRPDMMVNARHRPLPIKPGGAPVELTVSTARPKRNNSLHIPTPPTSPSPASPRTTITSTPACTNHTHSLARPPQHVRQAKSLQNKEREWLSKHQRRTVEDWRLEALERREQLERELHGDGAHSVAAEEGSEMGVAPVRDQRRLPRERHRCSTLRILNGIDAAPSPRATASSSEGEILTTADEKTPSAKMPEPIAPALPMTTPVATAGTPTTTLSEAEQAVERRLLQTLMPLLQSMESTLRDMKESNINVNPGLSPQLMESTIRAIAPSSVAYQVPNGHDTSPSS